MVLETNTLVSKTIYFSLVVQIITTIVSLGGLFVKIKDNDYVLKEILLLGPMFWHDRLIIAVVVNNGMD